MPNEIHAYHSYSICPTCKKLGLEMLLMEAQDESIHIGYECPNCDFKLYQRNMSKDLVYQIALDEILHRSINEQTIKQMEN
jgi:DNA-directed RNA polymerase subunit RPC12/RpoP